MNKHLKEILTSLNECNILNDIILIGSWSLFFYKYIFIDFKPTLKTTDIDFYVPNAKKIKEKHNLTQSLRELNYEMINDQLTNKTKYISYDGFEIEFLTNLNRGGLSCVKLGNTGIYAESLPYVEIFSGNYIEVEFEGIKLKVASPASYVIQKLLINSDRKQDKAIKDIESIKNVLLYLNASNKSRNELADLFKSLPKKWQKRISKTTTEYQIDLNL